MADKEHMKDGIIKRGNSYAAAVYTGRDATGKKQYRWVSAKSKGEVREKRTEILHQRNNGTLATPKGTLGEYLEEWLKEIKTYKLSPRTIEGYESMYRSGIGPALGKVPLKDLKADAIQRYYTLRLESGASSTTVRHHHMMLHRALRDAVRRQLLPFNPANADLLTLPPVETTEMHTFDEDDLSAFLDRAKDTPYFAVFHTVLHTGMRRSEVLALRWQDIDLLGAEASVTRAMHRLHDKEKTVVFRTTKTKKSTRSIALTPESCDVLRKHLDNEMTLCARTGVHFANDRLVFCHWDGQPLVPDTVSQAWYRLNTEFLKAGKITHRVRFHDGRHTHASLLFKGGVPDKDIQLRLGHAKISTTLDLYVHPAEGAQKKAAETFSKLLSKRATPVTD